MTNVETSLNMSAGLMSQRSALHLLIIILTSQAISKIDPVFIFTSIGEERPEQKLERIIKWDVFYNIK